MLAQDLDPRYATYMSFKKKDATVEWHDVAAVDCSWSREDLLRIQYHLIHNLPHVKAQRILDVSCGDGVLTEAMCQLGAQHVTAVDIRPEVCDLTRRSLISAGHDQVKVGQLDVYDRHSLMDLAVGHDTVHLGAMFFHVNNHFELLHAVSQAPKYIIIDAWVDIDHWYNNKPLISWRIEDNTIDILGMDYKTQDLGICFSGTPNLQWYSRALEYLGWCIQSTEYFHYCHFEKRLQRKCIISAAKH